MEEGEDEPTVVAPATSAESTGKASKSSPVESRTRKKVTFDLDLQVRTIPNRIPIYERRPAASTSYARSQHPVAFVPRPLDLKGKDRYLLGATTTKKIIDLFNLPNGFPSYPMPPKAGSKKERPHGAQAVMNANNPYYTFANFRTSKISRAALNLKQITAALGEHFDSGAYNEWETSKRVQSSIPISSATSSRHGARSASSLVNELGVSQTRKLSGDNAIAAFSPSRLRIHHHQPQSATQPSQPNLSPTPPRGYYPNHAAITDIPTSPPESRDRQRLPSVTAEQIALSNRSQVARRRSAASDSALCRLRRGGSPTSGPLTDGGGGAHELHGTGRDRPSSRCSTIETYVISNIPGAKQSPNLPSASSSTGSGARSAGSSAGHRRVIVGPNSRSVAWEAGIAIPINEPVLNVSTLRASSATPRDSGGLVQWQVTSRPPNLSI